MTGIRTVVRGWVAGVLAAGVWVALPTAAPAQSLHAVLEQAYRDNPKLQAQRHELKATDEGVAKAKAGWRPQVSVDGAATLGVNRTKVSPLPSTRRRYDNESISITLRQPLFDGFRTEYGVKAARSKVRAGRQNLLATEQQVLLDAVQAYMNVVRDREIVNLRRRNVRVARAQLRNTQDRFRVGDVTRTDVSLAEAALAGARAQLAEAQSQLEESKAAFAEVVGREPGRLRFPARLPRILPGSLKEALVRASRHNPNVLAAAFGEEAARHAVQAAFGELLPRLNLQAGMSISRQDAEGVSPTRVRDANVSLSLSVPLYQGGGKHAGVREARHKAEAAGLQVAVARRAVQKAVVQAWYNLQMARRLIDAASARVRATRLAYEGVQEEYKAGTRTTLDVLNARQDLNNARVELVQARAAQVSSAYALLAATGDLTARRLGLRVAVQDPEEHYRAVRSRLLGTRD